MAKVPKIINLSNLSKSFDDLQNDNLKDLLLEGLPSNKNELFKYSNLKSYFDINFQLAQVVKSFDDDLLHYIDSKRLENHYNVVFVNGIYYEELSDQISQYLKFNTMAKNLIEINENFEYEDFFTAFNTSFAENGFELTLTKSKNLDKPLHLIYCNFGDETLSLASNKIILEDNACAKVYASFVGFKNSKNFNSTSLDIILKSNANLEFTQNFDDHQSSLYANYIRVIQKKASYFKSCQITLKNALLRNSMIVNLEEEQANCDLHGIYLIKDKSFADFFLDIRHKTKNTYSNQLFKGILDDYSKVVFNGKVVVSKYATGVDSKQLNKSLLLSNDAKVYSRPQLDINHHEVKCAHGATIGQLNPEQLFYFKSRGIDETKAKIFLGLAFVNEVLRRIGNPSLEKLLSENSIKSFFYD